MCAEIGRPLHTSYGFDQKPGKEQNTDISIPLGPIVDGKCCKPRSFLGFVFTSCRSWGCCWSCCMKSAAQEANGCCCWIKGRACGGNATCIAFMSYSAVSTAFLDTKEDWEVFEKNWLAS